MVEQRTPSSDSFDIMPAPFDIHDGAINPIEAFEGLYLPKRKILLPEHATAETFAVSLDPSRLPKQVDSRHQVYFGNLKVDDLDAEAVALKTYNTTNGADNWRQELAALELGRRAGLPILTPLMLLQTRSGVTLLGTRFIPDLFDLDRRYMGNVPDGYEVDEQTMVFTATAALAAQHISDVTNGDAAPRNFAFRGPSSGDRKPIVTDPEFYKFPGQHTSNELGKRKKADLEYLIGESASLISKKEARDRTLPGHKIKVDEKLILNTKPRVTEMARAVYDNITGHSF